jgi:hypothetical protein
MTNVIPFKEPDPKCSFCGTKKSDASKFVQSGTGHNICGVCIAHCTTRLKQDRDKEEQHESS